MSTEETAQNFLAVEDCDEPGFRWTVQRHLFVHYYVQNGGWAKDAALKAGYAVSSAEAIGPELMTKAPIRKAVGKLLRKHMARQAFHEDDVIATWINWTKGNAYDYVKEVYTTALQDDNGEVVTDDRGNAVMDENGPYIISLKGPKELTKKQRDRVKSLSVTNTREGQNFKLDMHDQAAAMNNMAKFLGLMSEGTTMTPQEGAAAIREYLKQMEKVDGA